MTAASQITQPTPTEMEYRRTEALQDYNALLQMTK